MKKGFTLVELLAVIVLLAVLTTVTYPLFLNQFEDKQEEIDDYKLDLVYSAAKNYVKQNINDYPYQTGNIACLYVSDLVDQNLVQIELPDTVKNKMTKLVMTGNSSYNITLVDECKDSKAITYKTKTTSTNEIKNNVKLSNDRTYYFENDVLVREINNIAIKNQNKDSSGDFESFTTDYNSLYSILKDRDGIYTTFDHGSKTTYMLIDIDYKNDNYTDDTANESIYNKATLFIKYLKNTNISDIKD